MSQPEAAPSNIYDYSARAITGEQVSMARFRDQVCLLVNVASECGFTPQYQGLEALYQRYRTQGFTVLGFPCNQFGQQEPGGADEIGQFCQVNYGVSFPMFGKIDVNGAQAHPLYKYLTHEKRGILGTANIKWNFTKFLIDRAGNVVARYGSITKPQELKQAILKLL